MKKMETYQINTENFQGPFGLLLELVEKRKLFINDVSLATVTEDYLNYMNNASVMNSEEMSSFVLVASTLILLKSKSLLPNLDLTPEEESDMHNLEERLRLYELFARLGINIKNNFGRRIIFSPLEKKNNILVFLPDDQITRENMMTFARTALGKIPKKIFLPEVEVKKVVSIEEMIDKLTNRINNSLKMNFKDLNGKVTTREEKVFVIVGFLAMLELVRQGLIHAVQDSGFSEIMLEKGSDTVRAGDLVTKENE